LAFYTIEQLQGNGARMNRTDALELVRRHVKKENNVKHMIAVGAVMRQSAIRLSQDPERWEIVGILHDIDFETCTGAEDHCLKAQELLTGRLDDEAIECIMAHNSEYTHVPVDTVMKRALIASDASSGLVIACALVMPLKRLEDVKPESLIKKFGSKDFAKGVSRERIMQCEQIGISRDEFLGISLNGVKKVAQELGL
jgi:predicted hydrolase (HD superfamily)